MVGVNVPTTLKGGIAKNARISLTISRGDPPSGNKLMLAGVSSRIKFCKQNLFISHAQSVIATTTQPVAILIRRSTKLQGE